ncbi:MAG: hypothetical protein H0U52_14600 [Chloroflexi bacterium]|nr:hypothetical protein [Chloroflexota bacterium]
MAIVVGPRLLPATSTGQGAIQLGTDGLPSSIEGEPVLRGDQITERSATPGSFLAGGVLVLGSNPCPDTTVPPAAPCDEWWKLAGAAGAGPQFALNGMAAAPGFVRTSGALTVLRIERFAGGSSGTSLCTNCDGTLTVEDVAWRKPTKGPIPDNASPPQGGPIYPALVPDFVSTWTRDGTTIAGYVPKRYLVGTFEPLPGTPSNPPQHDPQPVYADDLTTLVGHMVPGVGFVSLDSSASPVGPSVSVAPSPSASTAPSSDPAVDCGRLGTAACEKAIALARVGHEAELASTSRIVADDSCAPSPVICDRLYPFDSIVVFVTAGADTTGWYAFHVTGLEYSVPTKSEPWLSDIPAHLIEHLTTASSSLAPDGLSAGGWGPLAIVPPQDGTDSARTEGTLRITDTCVFLATAGGDDLLVWPADRTTWNPKARTVTFANSDGRTVSAGDGTPVVMGGGGDSNRESGSTTEAWMARTPWVARPSVSCPLESRWWVGALTR